MNRTFTLCFSLYPIALPFGYVLIYTFYHYAVPDANSNIEYGAVDFDVVSNVELKRSAVKFTKTHNTPPKSIILSCQTYSYFYGTCIVDNSQPLNEKEFTIALTPIQIGNGKGRWQVYWVALW